MSLLTIFGITNAYAAASGGTGQGGGLMSILPMILIFIVFMYFIMIRPQSKRAKEHNKLISGIQKGDEVATLGGILGVVEKVKDDFIVITIAENVNISVRKSAIASTLPKGTIKSVNTEK
jgi:preprotein translocase subunit YajC